MTDIPIADIHERKNKAAEALEAFTNAKELEGDNMRNASVALKVATDGMAAQQAIITECKTLLAKYEG